jgi:release factor glutamine methyltransferase
MNYLSVDHAMSSIKDVLSRDSSRLAQVLTLQAAESRLEIRLLLERALNVNRAWLLTHDDQELEGESRARYQALLERRLAGEPIAYILGQREFYGRLFKVGPSVLIPRPETELLVDLAKARIPHDEPCDVLDLGTGSGCIAITLALERPACRVTAVERSTTFLELARENERFLGAQVTWREADWLTGLVGASFDVIVSNPPYVAEQDAHLKTGDVRFEPRSALASGPLGLNDLTLIIEQSPTLIRRGGWLLLEHGWDQGSAVVNLMKKRGFQQVQSYKDHAGLDRVTLGSVGKIDRPTG